MRWGFSKHIFQPHPMISMIALLPEVSHVQHCVFAGHGDETPEEGSSQICLKKINVSTRKLISVQTGYFCGSFLFKVWFINWKIHLAEPLHHRKMTQTTSPSKSVLSTQTGTGIFHCPNWRCQIQLGTFCMESRCSFRILPCHHRGVYLSLRDYAGA